MHTLQATVNKVKQKDTDIQKALPTYAVEDELQLTQTSRQYWIENIKLISYPKLCIG